MYSIANKGDINITHFRTIVHRLYGEIYRFSEKVHAPIFGSRNMGTETFMGGRFKQRKIALLERYSYDIIKIDIYNFEKKWILALIMAVPLVMIAKIC